MWHHTVPILKDTNSLEPLALYLARWTFLSEVERSEVQGAIALVHHSLIKINPSKHRTALLFNVAMSYLGYKEGQTEEVNQLAFNIHLDLGVRELLSLDFDVFTPEGIQSADKSRQLRQSTSKPRASTARKPGRSMRRA